MIFLKPNRSKEVEGLYLAVHSEDSEPKYIMFNFGEYRSLYELRTDYPICSVEESHDMYWSMLLFESDGEIRKYRKHLEIFYRMMLDKRDYDDDIDYRYCIQCTIDQLSKLL